MQKDIIINDIVVKEQIQLATRIGVDGVTFTPHIEEVSSSETILSFTNDGERNNPEPTNIKGEAFTYEDFTPEQITALQQPALDAAVIATNAANSALEAEEIIQENEDIRIASELSRVSAETIRNNREIIRNNNELGRISAEESRVTNEGLRVSAEEDRVDTELLRVSAEQTRALNEISRNNAEILRESNEDTRQENELSRISAENAREDSEDDRISAEVIRSSNEVNRINAELLRNSNESTRGINEGIRQDNEVTRIANENIRIANEGDETSGRVKAELDRVAAEQSRASAEIERGNSEATRAENESTRGENETSRVSSESTRVNNEATRGQSETERDNAETARNTAEQNRATAETARVDAEGDATKGRVKAENDRAAAEILRQQQEAVRVQAENDRITAGAIIQSQIVNNLSETAAGKVLDARQGPIILDMLTKMSENWVGVVVDPSLSCSEPAPKSTVVDYRATELQRTGNLEFHKFGKSRIFNAFYPAIVIRATKEIAWRLDKSDFTKKENGTSSVPDWTIHNICIVIPDLYRRIVLLDNTQDGRYEIRYDIAPFDGATLFHEESYHSISDAQMDRTLTQLVSVVSDDVRFRGGNNDATIDAQAWRTQLGMPATDLSRINFETYANNAGWEIFNIYDHTLFSELAMLYFANTNIQLDYTDVLTAEGYPQGGLGAGNTTWISKRWGEKNGYYPLDKVGEGSMSIGCKVGVKSKTVTNYYIGSVTGVTAGKCVSTDNFSAGNGWLASYVGYTIRNLTTSATATITAKDDDNTLSLSDNIFTAVGQIFHIEGATFNYGIPVFFGLENIYGHLWKHCSGINIMIQSADAGGRSMAYVNPDWATRSGTEITSNYQYVGDIPRADGYIKTLYPGWNIPKLSTGAGSNSFMADYFYTNIPASGSSLRCLVVSASAYHGAFAGLRHASSDYSPSSAFSYLGARLRAKKPKNG